VKILHTLASPFYSGPAESLLLLAQAQRALGHEVTVAVDRKRKKVPPAEEPLLPRVEALGLLEPAALELSVKSSPLAMLRDVAVLKKLEVDVVHCHFSHDHHVARLGRPRGATLVRSIHAPRSLGATTPAADAWTVPWDGLARKLLGKRVLVLPALVSEDFRPPADRPALRARLGLPDAPLVGMVSTFQASRRHAVGIEALGLLRQRRPEAQLVLVGDGALEQALRGQVVASGLADAVRFAGYQQGEAFAAWLSALDEVWVLGLGNDWAARAAAQARACGVRVVAVDEGALARYADVLVEPIAAAVAEAALGSRRVSVVRETVAEIAQRCLAHYGRPGTATP